MWLYRSTRSVYLTSARVSWIEVGIEVEHRVLLVEEESPARSCTTS